MKEKIKNIRNIGIIAHIDAGKTTTTERMLYLSGKIHRMGEVDDGNTTTDFLELEKERGITIASAVVSLLWNNIDINIIDTPGHVDFTAEVERSLRVLDGAVVIFSAVEGIESQSETVWHQSDNYSIPRIVYINKLDRVGADFTSVVEGMSKKFDQNPIVLQFPLGEENDFNGIIDIIEKKKITWDKDTKGEKINISEIPKIMLKKTEEAYENIIDKLCDFNCDDILECYVNNKEITSTQIKKAIRKLTIEGKIVPVLCGSSKKYIGIQTLLDSIINYLPSPLDRNKINAIDEFKNNIKVPVSPESPFLGLIFKVSADPHIGKIFYMRAYSGYIKNKFSVNNTTVKKREIIQKIFYINADKRKEKNSCVMGDIIGISGLKHSSTGHTLSNFVDSFYLEKPIFPEPVVSLAVETRTNSDIEKLLNALELLSMEDPTFKYNEDKDTGQLIISGMGELYLDILVERLRRDFNIHVRKGNPRVAYKESISKKNISNFQGERIFGSKKYVFQVSMLVEPEEISGTKFLLDRNVDKIESIEVKKAILNCQNNLQNLIYAGPLAGFPLTAIKVELLEVEYEDENIPEIVVSSIISDAFEDAIKKANPIILQPIMNLEVVTPEEFLGEVMRSLNSKLADITKIADRKNKKIIHSKIPLLKTFGYATVLRGITKGKATFTMQFERYKSLLQKDQTELLKKLKGL